MVAVKITVLKRTLLEDVSAAQSGNGPKPLCEVFKDGQVFITGLNKPDGFCDWAWTDISRIVLSIYTGGNFNVGPFNGWMKDSGAAISCCTDGFRPVIFRIERIDTKDMIDVSRVERSAPKEAYNSERWGEFSYAFPGLAPNAACAVRLHFCEIYHEGPGKRRFSVDINGKRVLEEFDVLKEAGGKYAAIVREFPVAADSSGTVNIDFKKGSADFPKLSAIEVIAGGKTAFAVNSGGGDAGAFKADSHFEGGNALGD